MTVWKKASRNAAEISTLPFRSISVSHAFILFVALLFVAYYNDLTAKDLEQLENRERERDSISSSECIHSFEANKKFPVKVVKWKAMLALAFI